MTGKWSPKIWYLHTVPENCKRKMENTQNALSIAWLPETEIPNRSLFSPMSPEVDKTTCVYDNTRDILANPKIRGAITRCRYTSMER